MQKFDFLILKHKLLNQKSEAITPWKVPKQECLGYSTTMAYFWRKITILALFSTFS